MSDLLKEAILKTAQDKKGSSQGASRKPAGFVGDVVQGVVGAGLNKGLDYLMQAPQSAEPASTNRGRVYNMMQERGLTQSQNTNPPRNSNTALDTLKKRAGVIPDKDKVNDLGSLGIQGKSNILTSDQIYKESWNRITGKGDPSDPNTSETKTTGMDPERQARIDSIRDQIDKNQIKLDKFSGNIQRAELEQKLNQENYAENVKSRVMMLLKKRKEISERALSPVQKRSYLEGDSFGESLFNLAGFFINGSPSDSYGIPISTILEKQSLDDYNRRVNEQSILFKSYKEINKELDNIEDTKREYINDNLDILKTRLSYLKQSSQGAKQQIEIEKFFQEIDKAKNKLKEEDVKNLINLGKAKETQENNIATQKLNDLKFQQDKVKLHTTEQGKDLRSLVAAGLKQDTERGKTERHAKDNRRKTAKLLGDAWFKKQGIDRKKYENNRDYAFQWAKFIKDGVHKASKLASELYRNKTGRMAVEKKSIVKPVTEGQKLDNQIKRDKINESRRSLEFSVPSRTFGTQKDQKLVAVSKAHANTLHKDSASIYDFKKSMDDSILIIKYLKRLKKNPVSETLKALSTTGKEYNKFDAVVTKYKSHNRLGVTGGGNISDKEQEMLKIIAGFSLLKIGSLTGVDIGRFKRIAQNLITAIESEVVKGTKNNAAHRNIRKSLNSYRKHINGL